ncbi:hypothetical protein pb186bvf_003575 [Paramecium bursaria]
MKCQICGSEMVVRNIQEVCLGCGHIQRSNLIFSKEQEFQRNVKRTKSNIMQKQDKEQKIHQTPQQHLQQNWTYYLKGFSKFIYQLASEVDVDIKDIWKQYLQFYLNKPLKSDWTIARRGHELPQNRVVNSKYLMDDDIKIKTEDVQTFDLYNSDDSVIEIAGINKKIQKNPQYIKGRLKMFIKQGKFQATGRKQSIRRRESISIDLSTSKDEFITNTLKNFTITDQNYVALCEVFYETYHKQISEKLRNKINDIKNIKDKHQKFQTDYFTTEQFNKMPKSMKLESYLLVDFIRLYLKQDIDFMDANFLIQHEDVGVYKDRNIKFLRKKYKQVYQFLIGTSVKSNKNPFPLEFTTALILIYSTSIINGKPLFLPKFIRQIKNHEVTYLQGFGAIVDQNLQQYKMEPQNLPSQNYLRTSSKKFIKFLGKSASASWCPKDIFIYIGCDQPLAEMAYSLLQKITADPYEYDFQIMGSILLAFKLLLIEDQSKALNSIDQIQEHLKQKVLCPLDYCDLQYCDMNMLNSMLRNEKFANNYYLDQKNNHKIHEKSQISSFYQPIDYQFELKQINLSNFDNYQHEKYQFFTVPDFDLEPSEVQELLVLLSQYMEGSKQILKYYYQLERLII